MGATVCAAVEGAQDEPRHRLRPVERGQVARALDHVQRRVG